MNARDDVGTVQNLSEKVKISPTPISSGLQTMTWERRGPPDCLVAFMHEPEATG